MNEHPTIHPADLACKFMQKARLKGIEVEAYAQTYNWLQSIFMGELVILLPKEVEDYKNQIKELAAELDELKLDQPSNKEKLDLVE